MSAPLKAAREPQLIGDSSAMRELREEIRLTSGCDANVLISGENGVGKSRVARSIHAQSSRARRAFERVDCAGVTDGGLTFELFGPQDGEPADGRGRRSRMEAVDGGTVFLDAIAEMSPRVQMLLLRSLENDRSDSGWPRSSNVRIISATNRPLLGLIARGAFCEDLFYRLNVIHLVIPPLREHAEDIPALAAHLLRVFAAKHRADISGFTPDAIRAIVAHSWPGNVCQLENVIERSVIITRGPFIRAADLTGEMRNAPPLRALPKSSRAALNARS